MGFFDRFKGGGGGGSTSKLPKEQPFAQDYQLVQDLLSGAMSTIHKVKHTGNGNYYVIKKVTPRTPESQKKLMRELEVGFQMSHENIVKVFAWEKKGDQYWILMEYVNGTSLRAYLREQLLVKKVKPPILTGRDYMTLFVHAARALQHVHGKGYLHLDVKPENFLAQGLTSLKDTKVDRSKETQVWKKEVLQQSAGIQLKLIDFGVSLRMDEPKTNVGGSPLYVAPEVVGGVQTQAQVGPQSDIWSLGATMYEVACGRPPFLPAWFDGKPQHWQALWGEYERQDPAMKKAYDTEMLKKRLAQTPDMARIEYNDPTKLILKKCLEIPYARRYSNCAALVGELERFL